MSIAVAIEDLPEKIADFAFAYLVTSGQDRPHLLAVKVRAADGALRCDTGSSSRANVARNPKVVMVFPPASTDAMSLIVDGDAVVDGDGVAVTPTWAVLHRAAV